MTLRAFETKAYAKGYKILAGVDEAGRGPLAGPVVAAACILPQDFLLPEIKDSKLLTPKKRKEIYKRLTENPDVILSVGIVESEVIDQINILQATFEAMSLSVETLQVKPDYLLIDGNQLPKIDIDKEAIVKGDSLSQSIAAASIIAKHTRDQIMLSYHQMWPEYNFSKHKGYATKAHIEAIHRHGPSPIHRISFEPIKSLTSRFAAFVKST